jgi:hypothetical protein
MQVSFFKHAVPLVALHHIVDDFGNETRIEDMPFSAVKRLFILNQAKRFITGVTFEEAGMLSLVPVFEAH